MMANNTEIHLIAAYNSPSKTPNPRRPLQNFFIEQTKILRLFRPQNISYLALLQQVMAEITSGAHVAAGCVEEASTYLPPGHLVV